MADFRIVERLVQRVRPEDILQLRQRRNDNIYVRILLQGWKQVVAGRLDEVDLALRQRIDRLLRVGDGAPFDAIDLGDLAARKARGRLGARLVLVELDVDGLVAGLPFIPDEDE